MKHTLVAIFTLVSLGAPLLAVETKTWEHDTAADFQAGRLDKLSLRSDGLLSLAPVSTEVLDSSLAVLWAVAGDSRGNIYTGGGGPGASSAKLFRISPDGTSKTLAEFKELEVQAIAVDSRDRVYAATAPDGKVYRISPGGRPEVFYNPKEKYIWAMAFNSKGELFLATGDTGKIYRVSPSGEGTVFFETGETHVRSLAIDAHDNLVVGTDPGGLILRISPAGKGFVLYQSAKREITAVAVAPDGVIYAAAIGGRKVVPMAAPPISVTLAPSVPTATAAPKPPSRQPVATRVRPVVRPRLVLALRPKVTGGSEIYRIDPDGASHIIWTNPGAIVYTIAIDSRHRPVLGAGNEGRIYRLENDRLSTLLWKAPSSQVVSLYAAPHGRLYAATANIGKLYRLGPGLDREGSYQGPVLDARRFSYWGRIIYHGKTAGGKIVLAARSGNWNRPQQNWSPWSTVALSGNSGIVTAPPARFVQYKVTLTSPGARKSPEVSSVELAYQNKNVAPVIRRIVATPPNYRFPPQTLTLTKTKNLTLSPLNSRKRPATGKPVITISGRQIMHYAKGFIGARWLSKDDNGDALVYKVEIRGAGETRWLPLKDKLTTAYLSWDSTAFPDGEYQLRVTASDSPDNPPGKALTARLVGGLFLIDNTPPRILHLSASLTDGGITASWSGADTSTPITKAEYSLDGGDWTPVEPVTRLSDSLKLDYKLTLKKVSPGGHLFAVRLTDLFANRSVAKTVIR